MLIRPHLSPADNRRIQAMLLGNQNGDLRQQLLDGAPFLAELTHTAVPQRAAPGTTATFTRATTATFTDFEGVLRTAPAGCARFVGARFVRNLFALGSENFTTANWTKVNGAFSGAEFTASGASSGFYQAATLDTGRTFLVWAKLSCESGTVATGLFANGVPVSPNPTTSSITVTTTPTIFSLTVTTTSTGSVNAGVGVYNAVPNGSSITVHEIQLEDITGRTDQTTPSEYVSVGVESAPYYHGSMVDGVKCFPTDLSGNPLTTMERYKPELAATNLAFKSNEFTTAPWETIGTPSITKNATGVDGATSAWTVTVSQGDEYNQLNGVILTAATYTRSIKIKKTTGAQSAYPVILVNAPATYVAAATIDTTNGTGTIWTAYSGWTITTSSVRVTSWNADFWLVELTFLATATNWSVGYIGAMTTNVTKSSGSFADADITGAAGTHVMQHLQLELGSKATSYIDNTSAVAAVTRNADVLTYSGGDIPNLKTLMAGFRRESGVSIVGVSVGLTDGTANDRVVFYLDSATGAAFVTGDGGVTQSGAYLTPAYTPGTSYKNAISFTTNSVTTAAQGVAQAADTTATNPTLTQLEVGHQVGALQLNGNVGGIYGWTRNFSQSELNAVTA